MRVIRQIALSSATLCLLGPSALIAQNTPDFSGTYNYIVPSAAPASFTQTITIVQTGNTRVQIMFAPSGGAPTHLDLPLDKSCITGPNGQQGQPCASMEDDTLVLRLPSGSPKPDSTGLVHHIVTENRFHLSPDKAQMRMAVRIIDLDNPSGSHVPPITMNFNRSGSAPASPPEHR